MKINTKGSEWRPQEDGVDFFGKFWEKSWTYIKTVVNVLHESVLILDKDLRIIAGNETFYRTFDVTQEKTEGKVIYELGNGQWDIPILRKFFDEILKEHSFFKGFQVAHDFPSIGRKVMILNAREIHIKDDTSLESSSPIIVLAIEDVTEMMVVAETLAHQTKQIEARFSVRTHMLEVQIEKLQSELNNFKNKP
ncbi:hypothetical protein C4565_02730 [Candidatus Parcubacteria bacterium]|jgi:PAS domain-containing protein|nr:MAG: hypothetical protein C4565_02730 [Candidatus Parcubacteria bacterium]